MKLLAYGVWAVLAMAVVRPCSAEVTDLQILKGTCDEDSVIATGKSDAELEQNSAPFLCDALVINFFDHKSGHILVQFAQTTEFKSKGQQSLGFSGFMEEGGKIIYVAHNYYDKKQIDVVDGLCEFFFSGKTIDRVACASRINEKGKRMEPVVVFNANPGQTVTFPH